MRQTALIYACPFVTLLLSCSVEKGAREPEQVGAAEQELRSFQGTKTGIQLSIVGLIGGGSYQFNPTKGSIQITLPGDSTPREGTALIGTSFMAYAEGSAVPVQVDFVDVQTHLDRTFTPNTPVPDAFDYYINVNGNPLCPAPLPNAALAIPGDITQPPYFYDVNSTVANFSCDAVFAKCIDWGYKPWQVNGIDWPNPGNAFGQCIFLARADYCAADTSNTEDGTLIDVFDQGLVRPTNTMTPGTDLSLEGIWVPADIGNADRGIPRRPAVLCLAKKRWDALPFHGPCNSILPDPRLRGPMTPGCPPVAGAQFCDEMSFDQWQQVGRTTYSQPNLGILINDSSYNDAGLYRWDGPTTGGAYTTSGYDIWKAGINGTSGQLGASFRYHCFEGSVYTAAEKKVRTDLLQLFSYRNAGGEFVTTTATTPPAGFDPASQHLEGYVVDPGSSNLPDLAAGLYQWQAAGHYITSTSVAERPPSAVLLGYLPRSASGGVPLCDTTLASLLPPSDFPSPLQITCPAPETVECNSGTGCANVTQPPPACGKAAISGPAPGCFPLGTTPTQYSAVDPKGNTATCSSSITVVDTKPPVVQGSPSVGELSPPNHKYHTVSLADCGIQIQDQCMGAMSLAGAQAAITCVTSDEPNNSAGSGHTDSDIVIVDATTVELRAERQGSGDGRVYHIGFSVKDSSGNIGQGSCQATVSQGSHAAVDSGVKYTVCH